MLNQPRDLTSIINSLSRADASQYSMLKQSFIHSQNSRTRDRRGNTFKQEIDSIIRFVDSRQEDRELRALATGLIRTGSYLCVNSQRLKLFVRRCKSSINNGFQQLGFESVKSRSRSNACLTAALPSIANQTNLGRQWTVRCIEKSGPPSATPQIGASIAHESPVSISPNSIITDSPTGFSTFQQMARERPKSAAPFVKSLLPVPILTSKSPLPMPKIMCSSNNGSYSSLPVQQNSSSTMTSPFLLDIAPPVQEDTLNDFQSQSNDIFSSWDLNFGLFGASSPTSTQATPIKSSSLSEAASSNNTSSFSSEMAPNQDSAFSFDQLSMDLHPFDDTNFTAFQDTNCSFTNDNWYSEEGVAVRI